MPFWKREEKKPAPPAPQPAKKEAERPKAAAPPQPPKPAVTPAKPAAKPAAERTPEEIVNGVHRSLVEAGLAIEGTREVFRKRAEEKFGSLDGFAKEYRADPSKAVTGFIASWLGFQVPGEFALDDLLYNANQRLSGFGVQVGVSDEKLVDRASGMREATFTLQEQQTVLQFQTPREVLNEVNAMIEDRGARFIELETWSDGYAFMLVKSPRWDKLASGKPVVVKAAETATDGDCPECGSKVGEKWASCIGCNAVFA